MGSAGPAENTIKNLKLRKVGLLGAGEESELRKKFKNFDFFLVTKLEFGNEGRKRKVTVISFRISTGS
jgi:hypothetical protein